MAYEIKAFTPSGQTLYCVLRNTVDKVWYLAGTAMETWGTSSRTIDDYDTSLTDNEGGMYSCDFPASVPAGYYFVCTHQQVGASPDDDDPLIYKEYGYWDETNWITETNYLKQIADDVTDLQSEGLVTRNITVSSSIIARTEHLIRRVTGVPALSYQDNQIIRSAFVNAVQDVCLDPEVPHWRFLQSEETATTTATVNYVDLGTDVYNIISGTVRIPAESLNLHYKEIEVIKSIDPSGSTSGPPQFYTFIASSTPEVLRLRLWPIPDGAYTINFTAETIPDTSTTSGFPEWCHAVLEDKTKMNALINLGLAEHAKVFEYSYKNRLRTNKVHQGYDGPIHVRRQGAFPIYNPGIESRCPS